MTNENVDAARIVEVLNRLGVVYLIIGGYATELHEVAGLRRRVTSTCARRRIATDRDNLDRLSKALTEPHALIRTDAVDGGLPFAHDAESLARSSMWTQGPRGASRARPAPTANARRRLTHGVCHRGR